MEQKSQCQKLIQQYVKIRLVVQLKPFHKIAKLDQKLEKQNWLLTTLNIILDLKLCQIQYFIVGDMLAKNNSQNILKWDMSLEIYLKNG